MRDWEAGAGAGTVGTSLDVPGCEVAPIGWRPIVVRRYTDVDA